MEEETVAVLDSMLGRGTGSRYDATRLALSA
jgi:hypothetical protein